MYQIYSLFLILVVTSIIGSLLYKSHIEHFKQMATSRGCEKDILPKITCPKGQIVSGVNVKYGRWNNKTCSHGTVKSNTKASSMTFDVPSSYLGKQSVDWKGATIDKLAGKDPSPHIYKHFEMTPTCKRPDSSIALTGCENAAPSVMNCPPGSTVSAATMKYGRWNNKICPHATVKSNTAAKSQTYPIANTYLGKPSLDFKGAGALSLAGNKDPYPGMFKQYEINATCHYA